MKRRAIRKTMAAVLAGIVLVGTTACGDNSEYRPPMQRMLDAFGKVEKNRQQQQQDSSPSPSSSDTANSSGDTSTSNGTTSSDAANS